MGLLVALILLASVAYANVPLQCKVQIFSTVVICLICLFSKRCLCPSAWRYTTRTFAPDSSRKRFGIAAFPIDVSLIHFLFCTGS